MSYVLTNGATGVVTYPYSIGLLRRDNPNVSFPSQPDDALLSDWNVYPVTNVPAPEYDRLTQDLTEVNPVSLEGNDWTQTWLVTNVDQATAAIRTAQAEQEAADEAMRRLQDVEQNYIDAMIAGYGFTAEMTQYVDDLENYSGITGFPKLEEMQWPELPQDILDPANPNLPVSIYTSSQVDTQIANAVSGIDTYTRSEVDALIAAAVQSLLVSTRSGEQINILG